VTDETMSDGTSTTARALRWAAAWSLAYIAAQTCGVLVNGLLYAADALGMATNDHQDLATGEVFSDFVWPLIPGLLTVMSGPFALALIVLWFAGRHRGPVGFRVLSLIMFLWITPVQFFLWDIGWSFWTWLIAQLLIAVTIQLPGPYRPGTS
jgi:hypothetical protein